MDKETYIRLVKDIDERLGDILQEYSDSALHLKNDGRFVRTRVLLAFSLSDVMSIVYGKYWDINLKSSELLKQWWATYCLNEENEVYRKHPYIKLVSEDRLNLLRNSIVHAFALPEEDGSGLHILIVNGSESAQNAKLWDSRFKRNGVRVAIISPDSLNALFVEGARIMLAKMFPNNVNPTEEELLGAERVYKEFERRASHRIKIG